RGPAAAVLLRGLGIRNIWPRTKRRIGWPRRGTPRDAAQSCRHSPRFVSTVHVLPALDRLLRVRARRRRHGYILAMGYCCSSARAVVLGPASLCVLLAKRVF